MGAERQLLLVVVRQRVIDASSSVAVLRVLLLQTVCQGLCHGSCPFHAKGKPLRQNWIHRHERIPHELYNRTLAIGRNGFSANHVHHPVKIHNRFAGMLVRHSPFHQNLVRGGGLYQSTNGVVPISKGLQQHGFSFLGILFGRTLFVVYCNKPCVQLLLLSTGRRKFHRNRCKPHVSGLSPGLKGLFQSFHFVSRHRRIPAEYVVVSILCACRFGMV
mmetsp:Transcript_2501/g.5469  ORF Transcript_2501/g.5469 Transcript_2501/m.5469 type:complete len:217 (+) Transcript_2501:561-1211(+)